MGTVGMHVLSNQCGLRDLPASRPSSSPSPLRRASAPTCASVLAAPRTPFPSSSHCLLQAASARRPTVRARAQAAAAEDNKPPSPSWPAKILGLLPSLECVVVLQRVWQLLCKHLWAVVLIYAIKDSLQFVLHRVTHRVTNYAAEVLFKYPIADEVINAWWLVLDQEFLQQYPGYQIVMGALFVVAMPINLLLAATASATTVLLCAPPAPSSPSPPGPSPAPTGLATEQQHQPATAPTEGASSSTGAETAEQLRIQQSSPSTSASSSGSGAASTSSSAAVAPPGRKAGWFSPITRGWREAAATLPLVRGMLGRVWWTESVVSVIGLALQAGMMLVVTVPWLLPIYLSAQLAGVTTVVHGDRGLKAIESSAKLMQGRKRVVFWPLLALILGVRLVDTIKTTAFAAMPPRLWTEAVELPLVAYVLLQSLRIAASRLQDLLPVGMYLYLQHTHQRGPTGAAPQPAAAAAAEAAAGLEGVLEAEAVAGFKAEAAAVAEAGVKAAVADEVGAAAAAAAMAAAPEPATTATTEAEGTAAPAAEAPAVVAAAPEAEPAPTAATEVEATAAAAEAEPEPMAATGAEGTAAPAAEAEPESIVATEVEATAAPAAEAPAAVAAAPEVTPKAAAAPQGSGATAAPEAEPATTATAATTESTTTVEPATEAPAAPQSETTAGTTPPPPPPAST